MNIVATKSVCQVFGHAMKLIHNMICHTIFLATSEGCLLAEKVGIPLEMAVAGDIVVVFV